MRINHNIPLIFLLLFIGTIAIIPAHAQISENVVINEVDINPPGNDSSSISEWVELYNPTDSDIDISNWEIASTTVLKKTMTLPPGTIIEPGQFLTYSYQTVWFTDIGESVELRDQNGLVIDKTPILSDTLNDFKSSQRIFDGFDLDRSDDWKFATSTAGSSNGKLVQTENSDNLTIGVSSEKDSYIFGETAVIKGHVSKEVFIVKPFFQAEKINVTISGPNFYKNITLYPDLNLNYETTLDLKQVLGVNEGFYDVLVTYGDASAKTSFAVGFESTIVAEKEESSIDISTDKSEYIPGDLMLITGFTSEVIPFEGLTFTVIDSNNDVIANGNLFPTDGEFKTSLFVTTVDPSYGTYQIKGEYFGKSVMTTFEVVEDYKENVPISLWTDKSAYSLDEKVEINGRLNDNWIGTIDLEILQTRQSSIGNSSIGSDSGFKIIDSITVLGDGSFAYDFTIPDNSIRLGDYKITVSKEIGSATTIIHAVNDPDNFVPSDERITIDTDKSVYDLGDTMFVTGFIKDPFSNSSYVSGTPVNISITHEDGTPLEIIGLDNNAQTRSNGGVIVDYDFTAIPESSGTYSTQIDIANSIFTEGNYILKAEYLGLTATKNFNIFNSLDLQDGAVISLDKEVYGLGETVFLTGIFPPTGTSGVEISLTKPDGTQINSGTIIDAQRFSWSWITPVAEKLQIDKNDERNVTKSNFGVYKLKVSVDSYNEEVFFKVSSDPENDSLSIDPIFVSTEKSIYKAGDKLKVIGNVISRVQGDEGLVVPERVTIQVLDGKFPYPVIRESSVYPDQGGQFSSLFELPATIFSEGNYTVKAVYNRVQTDTTFGVTNDFTFGLDEPVSLILSSDKSEYHAGDVVVISGKPNKLIYLEKFDISVIQQTDNSITCGSFYCGTHTGSVTSIRPSPSGSFTHQFVIPDSESALGSYEVVVDADFDTKSILFNVLAKPEMPKLDTIIEKENRISDKVITILTEEKTIDDTSVAPRVLSGSLITISRSDESTVNLKVTSTSGVCVIGPDADCLVTDSTRKPGQIYDVVQVDGTDINVRYSGPDVRLEKFSIVPEDSNAFLPDAAWTIDVIRSDDQVSRFYYKTTYKTTE